MNTKNVFQIPGPVKGSSLILTPDELWLRTICLHNGVAITDIQLSLLSRYRELLADWNTKINLISRKDAEHIWDTHILLSLAYVFVVPFPVTGRVLDLGTGGGLPGIVLAVMRPECSFTLLDSIRKKTTAVSHMATELGLSNVDVVNARAEEINHLPRHRNIYDIVTARSVSELSNLLSWGLPFLKKKGASASPGTNEPAVGATRLKPSIVMLKGSEIETELAAARKAFPHVRFESTPLVFRGSEGVVSTDKQIIVAQAS
ncbi:MAG TPA: 16S rRNA (guanine(527)-N(7))-methyltransferase RsmG [Bacteroidota bacterium]|nr:16S rRNA (guanine(527)-N(7))-methyltransferase RsmG [Bacteroidota bacterium]